MLVGCIHPHKFAQNKLVTAKKADVSELQDRNSSLPVLKVLKRDMCLLPKVAFAILIYF